MVTSPEGKGLKLVGAFNIVLSAMGVNALSWKNFNSKGRAHDVIGTFPIVPLDE